MLSLDAHNVRFIGAKPLHAGQIGNERRKSEPRKRPRERYQPMIRLAHRTHSVNEDDAPARERIAPVEGITRRIGIRKNSIERNLGSYRLIREKREPAAAPLVEQRLGQQEGIHRVTKPRG